MKGKKTGGRKKGIPNRDTQEISEMLKEKFPDYHPVIALAAIANNKKVDLSLRLQANKEVAKYVCPQLKAMELNFHNSTLPEITIIEIVHTTKGELEKSQVR